MRLCDPVGIGEIAARAGVTYDTAERWRRRNPDFPAPRWKIGGRPAWNWDDVTPWLIATHRMEPVDG